MTAFRKMHGLGNDFVVFDGRNGGFALDERAARAVADRRFGVGCDQVIAIERSETGADATMRIYNADGDEVEACGNAARCVAHLLLGETREPSVHIDTLGGLLECSRASEDSVTVDMGRPHLEWQDIPLSQRVDTREFPLDIDGRLFDAAAVSVGNPHCVLFVKDADAAPVAEIGPRIERHPLFPARANVEFVTIVSPSRLRMRVWERGVGITRACGTGACAALVAAHRRGLCARKVDVALDGGILTIEWRDKDDHILMTGGATLAFTGDVDLAGLELRS
ncbi:MAG: diaminopimelate epimerase [Rhizomicrobium sp.]|jgi:diaminopimelate epimerase